MIHATQYGAPWSRSLKLVTFASAAILIGVAAIGYGNDPGVGPVWPISMTVLPLAILIGAALFMIRGYELTHDSVIVQRLGWRSVIDLAGLRDVRTDPEAMEKSLRLFGNGGLFCFAGKFRNKRLGTYRAFATDPGKAVVLRFDDRVVVVTPDDPERFVASLKAGRLQ